jgi:hypothetical protein
MTMTTAPRPRFVARLLITLGAVALLGGAFAVYYFLRDEPVRYADDFEHFKYGSIGSEPGGSVFNSQGGFLPPYGVFKALPSVCPEMLPGGYRSLGLFYEKERDLPVGVSKRRRLGLDLVGVNCALCHVGTVADGTSANPRLVAGMPAVRTDVHRLMKFMIDCVLDDRFETENVVQKVREAGVHVGWVDRLVYARMLPELRKKIGTLKADIGFLTHEVPSAGPGRLDTFNPLKGLELHWPLGPGHDDELTAPVDFPPLWHLPARDGRGLHWDGNLDSVDETVRSAVLGVGAKPRTLDRDALERVTRYIMQLQPPAYPYPEQIDHRLARQGAALFQTHCASCHEERSGQVTDVHRVGTDSHRFLAFSAAVAEALPRALRERYPGPLFSFTHFRKTRGYVNVPLDGIWARAPYLHNGSVPSLEALLEAPEARPKFFVRGSEVWDPERLGFLSLPPSEGARFAPPVAPCPRRGRHDWTPSPELQTLLRGTDHDLFLYDTTCPGNDNRGHDFGTTLPPTDKRALLEYLKTL